MTEHPALRALASSFEPGTYDIWRQLVEKALKGADFDKRLVSRSADGLRIEPLYTRADELKGAAAAMPGAAPFTRGTNAQPDGLGWQIHQRLSEPDPTAANKCILEELEGGANGIVLQIESPGQFGIKITSPADMATTLAGVYLDYAPIQLKGGLAGADTARHFLGALSTLGFKPGTVRGHLNIDPLGTFTRFGSTWAPLEVALSETINLAAKARSRQELAFLAATLVSYLRAFEAAGTAAEDAFRNIAFALSVDTDLFLGAAKIRAARRILARIGEASGRTCCAQR
jgi:methylmalonyl-CoA mutase